MLDPKSQWVKRRYYVEDGYLKPIPGSKADPYDPFTTDPPPYLELAALDLEDERAVEGFVSRFGLLGLFQQQRHEEAESWESKGRRDTGMAYSMEWVPIHLLHYLPGLTRPTSGQSKEQALERLRKVLATEELWDFLAEPIGDFREAAKEFQAAYLLAVNGGDGRRAVGEAEQLKQRFEDHLRVVRPVTDFNVADDGVTVTGWAIRWTFPSLLSACYHQLRLELVGGQDLRLCKNERCRKPFTAKTKKHYYCCDACGNAQEQRERRRDPDRKLKRQLERERPAAAAGNGQH